MRTGIGWFSFMVFGGLIMFLLGFITLADGDTLKGGLCIIFSLVELAFVLALFSKEFQGAHPGIFALGELVIGVIVCIVNIKAIHEVNPATFYSVLSAGVLSLLKGMKDLLA